MGETFGRYTVVRQLGRGAMGVVYLATDPMLNRQVAVKTVDLGIENAEEREFLRSRLLRDARAAAVLKHPNIVGVYDVFEDGARAFVVMEFVEGDNLASLLKSNPLPDAARVLRILHQMADALDYTHAMGVIHRDIKPANVMIDSSGTAKIMDFGIARIVDTRTVTPTGMVMGTVEYMAPEQILGAPVDGRADQFALAVVAYQMMTGSTLFGPNTLATLTYKIVNEAPTPACTRNAALPRGVDAVLAKGLAKNAIGRFTTCGEFVNALAQAFAEAPTAPVAPPTIPVASPPTVVPTLAGPVTVATARTVPPQRSSKAGLVAAAAAAALVVGGGMAMVVWKPWAHTAQPVPAATAAATPVPTAATAAPEPGKSAPTVEPDTAPRSETNEIKTEPKPKSETPPVVPKPPAGKVELPPPPKPEPVVEAKAEPVKAPSTPPRVTPTPPALPKAVEPEPVDDTEPLVLPPEPNGSATPTPYTQAMQQGQQQVKANNFTGAVQSFSRAISLHPDAASAHYSRGTAYQHLEQFDAAMRDFTHASQLDPNLASAYTGLGGCLVKLHRDPEAFTQFQRALTIKPDAVLALAGRGNIYLRRKQYRLALQDYNKALSVNPNYPPVYQNRAIAKEAIGDFPGATADRRRFAELRKE